MIGDRWYHVVPYRCDVGSSCALRWVVIAPEVSGRVLNGIDRMHEVVRRLDDEL